MRKSKAFKTVAFAALIIMLTAAPAVIAKADSIRTEEGVAGIARSLDNLPDDFETVERVLTELYNANIRSPLYNTGVSKASNYVNVRKEPSTESEITGKLYRGCAAEILEWLDGGWVRIKSGKVEGYIASDYLAIGEEAEAMARKYATIYAKVTGTQTLRVRKEPSTESTTLELIPEGEKYIVIEELEDWVKILITTDENNRDLTGYVHKDYVTIEIIFKKAISIEEEQEAIRRQREAEAAEAERKRMQEEAERAEAARRKAEEEARKAAEQGKAQEQKSESESKPSSEKSGSLSALRKEIVAYALKFVGYPYQWGGESLTKGADCSGFVWKIYHDFGYSLPRVSYEQAASAGKKVSLDDRQPGDLLFYGDSRGNVNHVAMYIGNDQIVHAANSRQGIIISKYNYRKVLKIRRVVN